MRHHDLELLRLRGGRPDHHPPPGAGALSRRTERLSDLIQTVLADLVHKKVKDPRVSEVLLTFTEVDVAPDLSQARVGVSVMGDDEVKQQALQGLQRAAPFLQREMNREVHLRRIPSLVFHLDESMEYGDQMTQRLRDVARSEGREL